MENEWLDQLERLGPEQVRLLLAVGDVGTGAGASFPFVGKRMAPGGHPDRRFVEGWLHTKAEQANKRSDQLYRLAWVAAGSGVIGAVLAFISLLY